MTPTSPPSARSTPPDPGHQGKGIFRRLTLEGLDLVRPHAAFVFNTPNAQSLPGYLKFGWQVVGEISLHIRISRSLRLSRHARAAMRARGESRPVPNDLPTAAEVLADADAVEALIAAQPPDERLHTAHTPVTLRWRYAEAPNLDYRAIPIRRDGELVAFGLGRLRSRGPLTELTLADTIVRPGDSRAATDLLRAAAKAGGDHVITHLAPGTLSAEVARRAGYLRAPGQAMTLVANPRHEAVDASVLAPAPWRPALGDLEVF